MFDLDGTVVDSVELIIVSFQHAIREVLGRELSREDAIAWVGMPLIEQMQRFSPEHAEELVEVYREFNHREHDRMLTLYEGIQHLLSGLREAGVKVGLVTSKSRFTTQMAFDLTGIEAYFDATVCAGEASGQQALARPHTWPAWSSWGSSRRRPPTWATALRTSRPRSPRAWSR